MCPSSTLGTVTAEARASLPAERERESGARAPKRVRTTSGEVDMALLRRPRAHPELHVSTHPGERNALFGPQVRWLDPLAPTLTSIETEVVEGAGVSQTFDLFGDL